jgi:hypothetical protein
VCWRQRAYAEAEEKISILNLIFENHPHFQAFLQEVRRLHLHSRKRVEQYQKILNSRPNVDMYVNHEVNEGAYLVIRHAFVDIAHRSLGGISI